MLPTRWRGIDALRGLAVAKGLREEGLPSVGVGEAGFTEFGLSDRTRGRALAWKFLGICHTDA
eukprot:1353286-Amorphochlora_amoeboformis.AAC.1